jgi:DNA invertase Pin-like site-specific DNA recombinase
MTNDLTAMVIGNLNKLTREDVRSISAKINSKTGKEEFEINLNDGRTLIQTNFISGVSERTTVELPEFKSITERNEAMRTMKNNGRTQNEIARIFNVSQTTVSSVLRA